MVKPIGINNVSINLIKKLVQAYMLLPIYKRLYLIQIVSKSMIKDIDLYFSVGQSLKVFK